MKFTKKYWIVKGRHCINFSVRESEKMYVRRILTEKKLALPTLTIEEVEKFTLELQELQKEIRQYIKEEIAKLEPWVKSGLIIKQAVIRSPHTGMNYNYAILGGTKFAVDNLPEVMKEYVANHKRRMAAEEIKGECRLQLVEEAIDDEFIQTPKK